MEAISGGNVRMLTVSSHMWRKVTCAQVLKVGISPSSGAMGRLVF